MTTIKLKNGSGAPLAGDLVQGEPALDLTNKRLYTEDSGGTVIEVGTNPTSLTTGTFTSTGIDDNAASTAMTLDSSGRLLVGHSSSVANFGLNNRLQVQGTSAETAGVSIVRNSNDANSSFLLLGKTRSTSEGGFGLVTNGDNVGNISFTAADGVDQTSLVAQIVASVDGVASADDTPGRLTFLTTPDGSQTSIERMRIDSSGNVGVNTSSPVAVLDVVGGSGDDSFINSSSDAGVSINNIVGGLNAYSRDVSTTSSGGVGGVYIKAETAFNTTYTPTYMAFHTHPASANDGSIFGNATEAMRIDSSGNLLVGTTDNNVTNNNTEAGAGINIGTAGFKGLVSSARWQGNALELNRMGTDGAIAIFSKDGASVGSIGSSGGVVYVTGPVAGGLKYSNYDSTHASIFPCTTTGGIADNLHDMGYAGSRFDDIYATNGTIQTSDRNEKQDIEALSDAEQRVAVAAKGLLRKFRWIDSVEEKGDDARIHFGIIAQDLQDAFTAEGLDAGRYAMFISSTWWESTEVIPAVEAQEAVVDEEGNVVEEAVEAQEERTVVHTHDTAEEAPEGSVERTRLGVRYSELLAFIIAAI